MEALEDLRGLGFTWTKISRMFGVSRWTIKRRTKSSNLRGFSAISEEELDNIVREYVHRHGGTTGQTLISGYIRSLGLRIQRKKIRKSLVRIDPKNSALRMGIVVHRRKYYVPWPNSLWHIDGHHSLIRWGLVIHGCIDGYSRRIIFLNCSNNNLSETVLTLFMQAIRNDNGLWPSRIRVDYGVENVLVCDAMVQERGEGRGSFLAGPSTRNQRIERLWRDVFRCVAHMFYYVFYALEDSGLLNIDDPVDMLTLQFAFMPRINYALQEYLELYNNHPMRTANNWSPYQMWLNGMFDDRNPLAAGDVDDDPEEHETYGIDPMAPAPFETSNNNVIIPDVEFSGDRDALHNIVLAEVDPLEHSNNMGIDTYIKVKDIMSREISQE